MKRILMAGVAAAVLGVSGPALAADLPTKGPAPVAAALFDWTGFYIGVNAGWARYQAYPGGQLVGCGGFGGTCVQPGGDGWTLGGQLGFNWQMPGSAIVLGVEADLNWLDLSATRPCANPAFTCGTSVDWQGSVRGRLGFAVVPQLLLYVTGGVAFSELRGFTRIVATGVTFPDKTSRTGWIAGIGGDWAVNNNLIFGVEWLHAEYGKKNHVYDVTYGAIPLKTDLFRGRLSYLFNWGR